MSNTDDFPNAALTTEQVPIKVRQSNYQPRFSLNFLTPLASNRFFIQFVWSHFSFLVSGHT